MDKPIFNKQPIIDAIKKYYLKDELKYLSKFYNISSLSPEIQESIKPDIQKLLQDTFEDLEEDIIHIEENIAWFRREFENIVEDTKTVFNRNCEDDEGDA